MWLKVTPRDEEKLPEGMQQLWVNLDQVIKVNVFANQLELYVAVATNWDNGHNSVVDVISPQEIQTVLNYLERKTI